MKVAINEFNGLHSFHQDEYTFPKNHTYQLIPIISYAPDIDMKDVEQNQAWKFKIDDKGFLEYDQEKINKKLNDDIIAKRLRRYQIEVDPLTLEALRNDDINLLEQANKIVEKIKKELPKKEA